MNVNKAAELFETITSEKANSIQRCSAGIANYVFIVSAESGKYVLRCSAQKDAYKETIRCLHVLSACHIPIPTVIAEGSSDGFDYLILSYIEGDDIGNVYSELTDEQKRQIAREVIAIQKKVSELPVEYDEKWNWNNEISDMLDRANHRIGINRHFDVRKVESVRTIQEEMWSYFDNIHPAYYLDDISTKNLLISNGKVSGVIDIDWLVPGDVLTFIAMTRVALLNMEMDTKYADYLLDELHPGTEEYRAYTFYCLMYCVDFMGERGMQFLDKKIPVNQTVIDRLNGIFDMLLEEYLKLER